MLVTVQGIITVNRCYLIISRRFIPSSPCLFSVVTVVLCSASALPKATTWGAGAGTHRPQSFAKRVPSASACGLWPAHPLSSAKGANPPRPPNPPGWGWVLGLHAKAAGIILSPSGHSVLSEFALLIAGLLFFTPVFEKKTNTLLAPAIRSAYRSSLRPYVLFDANTFISVSTT